MCVRVSYSNHMGSVFCFVSLYIYLHHVLFNVSLPEFIYCSRGCRFSRYSHLIKFDGIELT